MSEYEEIMKIVNKEIELEKRERSIKEKEAVVNQKLSDDGNKSQEEQYLKAVAKAMGLDKD